MIRKPYLITQAIKSYLLASVLTTAIGQLNSIVDGVLMGQILGPDALSAIMLSVPMMIIVAVVYFLFSAGAALLAGKAIGARDYEKSSAIFSVSMVSLAIFGVGAAALAWTFREPLTSWLCTEERLYPLALQYLSVGMGLSFVTMFSQAFSQFTDVDGNPRLVTRAMALSVSVNILLDIVLVAICGVGIAGSALATVIGNLISCIYLLRYLTAKTKSYRFRLFVPSFLKVLGENVMNGGAMMVMVAFMAGCSMFLNNVILEKLGADGMFVMSITGGLMGIGSLLTTGASQAFAAVGGMLFGQKDFRGLRLLFVRCVALILVASVSVTLIGQLCPEAFAVIYGAKTPELIASSSQSLRIVTLMFIPFMLMTLMPSVYQILGHLKLVGLMTLSFYGILLPVIWFLGKGSDPWHIWYAFPLAGWGGLLLCLPFLLIAHRKNGDTQPITLIPNVNPYHRMMDISIPASQEAVNEAMMEVRQFVGRLDTDSPNLKNNIELCTEELLENIVQYSGIKSTHFIDLRITQADEEIFVTLKDNGKAFDPVSVDDDKQGLGLLVAKTFCSKMEYKYMYGQNMTFLEWNRDDTKNEYKKNTNFNLDQFNLDKDEPTVVKESEKSDGPLLSLRGIHKTYPGATPLHVLKGVDLDINEGELVSIMGASGSGKSTLLNVIGILDDYDEGEYRLGGHLIKNLTEDEEADFRNEMIGFIFQTFNLVNYKNALDNVALPLVYRGVDCETRNKLAMEYLEKVGLAAHWDHTPMQMSGGQRQRVAIARALIQHPKIILADEPTGALDSKTTQEVMDMLREVNRKEGQTVIIVTHEQEIADQTDRRIFFKDGLIFKDERD